MFGMEKKEAAQGKSTRLSLHRGRMVHGYEIKRLPIGGYLSAVDMLSEAPRELADACFPGMTPEQVLAQVTEADKEQLLLISFQALGIVPGFVVTLFSQLSGIPEKTLLTDPAIGLDGLTEMIEAWVEVNGIGNFTGRLKRWAGALLKAVKSFPPQRGGSNA